MAKKKRYPVSHENAVEITTGGTLKERLAKIDSEVTKKADIASPTFTGTPKAPTASASTNSTQIATTAFVQSLIDSKIASADAMIYKGTIGSGGTVTSLPAVHTLGWTYKVMTAGTYAGKVCEVGDMIICNTTGTTSNNSHWDVIQTNIDGAVTRPSNSVQDNLPTFANATGKVVKDSGVPITTLVRTTRKVNPGTGLTGGGTLGSDVTLAHQAKPTSGSDAGGSGSVVSGVTIDTMGHVVSTTKTTVTTITGNAGTATKLQTARNIAITGSEIMQSYKGFDGSKDVTINLNGRICFDLYSATDSPTMIANHNGYYSRFSGGTSGTLKVNTVLTSVETLSGGFNLDSCKGRIAIYVGELQIIPVDMTLQKHDEGINSVWVGNFKYNNIQYSILARESSTTIDIILFKSRGATSEIPTIPIGWPQSSLKEAVGVGFRYYDETVETVYELDKNYNWLYEEYVTA